MNLKLNSVILSGTSFQDVLDSCGMLLKKFIFKINGKSTKDTQSLDTNEKFSRVQSTDESFVTSFDLSSNRGHSDSHQSKKIRISHQAASRTPNTEITL